MQFQKIFSGIKNIVKVLTPSSALLNIQTEKSAKWLRKRRANILELFPFLGTIKFYAKRQHIYLAYSHKHDLNKFAPNCWKHSVLYDNFVKVMLKKAMMAYEIAWLQERKTWHICWRNAPMYDSRGSRKIILLLKVWFCLRRRKDFWPLTIRIHP